MLDQYIKEKVCSILTKRYIPDTENFIETDSFGEVIDKLIIVHIRTWMLEDMITKDISDEDLGKLKRKIDICFKQKRPKLVQALGRLIEKSVLDGKSLVEDSVKIYTKL